MALLKFGMVDMVLIARSRIEMKEYLDVEVNGKFVGSFEADVEDIKNWFQVLLQYMKDKKIINSYELKHIVSG